MKEHNLCSQMEMSFSNKKLMTPHYERGNSPINRQFPESIGKSRSSERKITPVKRRPGSADPRFHKHLLESKPLPEIRQETKVVSFLTGLETNKKFISNSLDAGEPNLLTIVGEHGTKKNKSRHVILIDKCQQTDPFYIQKQFVITNHIYCTPENLLINKLEPIKFIEYGSESNTQQEEEHCCKSIEENLKSDGTLPSLASSSTADVDIFDQKYIKELLMYKDMIPSFNSLKSDIDGKISDRKLMERESGSESALSMVDRKYSSVEMKESETQTANSTNRSEIYFSIFKIIALLIFGTLAIWATVMYGEEIVDYSLHLYNWKKEEPKQTITDFSYYIDFTLGLMKSILDSVFEILGTSVR